MIIEVRGPAGLDCTRSFRSPPHYFRTKGSRPAWLSVTTYSPYLYVVGTAEDGTGDTGLQGLQGVYLGSEIRPGRACGEFLVPRLTYGKATRAPTVPSLGRVHGFRGVSPQTQGCGKRGAGLFHRV